VPADRAPSAQPTPEADDTWIDEEWLEAPPSPSPVSDVDISLGHAPHPTNDAVPPGGASTAVDDERTTVLEREPEAPEGAPPHGSGASSSRVRRRLVPRPRAAGEEARRQGRLLALTLIAVVLIAAIVPLVLDALDGSGNRPADARLSSNPGAASLGAPAPQPLANANEVALSVPIAQRAITAVLYHPLADSNAVELDPVGKLRNGNLLDRVEGRILGDQSSGPSYYSTDGPRQVVDVGASAGTEVYSPVDGTIISIVPNVISGRAWGQVVMVSPTSNPGVVLRLAGLQAAAGLAVGQSVKPPGTADPTLLGTVADLSRAQKLTLAQYTNDPGNAVELSIAYAAVTQ
jgi:hypothetical protein